jgi:hypothetical protein
VAVDAFTPPSIRMLASLPASMVCLPRPATMRVSPLPPMMLSVLLPSRRTLLPSPECHYADTLLAGSGLDWFWATYPQDHLNAKKHGLRN